MYLLYPLCSFGETVYFYGNEVGHKDIQEVIEQNPVGSQENIKSTLIHKTEDMSIHLIQIRFKEKPHIHKTHDLLVTLKKGRGILHIGNNVITMSGDDTAIIPRGVVHYFENSGEGVAVGLGIFVPAYDGTDNVVVEERKP